MKTKKSKKLQLDEYTIHLPNKIEKQNSTALDGYSKNSTLSVKHVPYGKLLCYITYKIRRNTPEENVRQRVAKSIVQEYGYKKTDIDVEFTIKLGSSQPRIDLPVFFEGTPHTHKKMFTS